MAKLAKSSKRGGMPRLPAVLNPKRMLAALAGVATALGAIFIVHQCSGDETKAKIESATLVLVDVVREARATPPEVVFWLDLVADAMPMMRGRGVPVANEELGDDKFTPGGEPEADRPLTRLVNRGYVAGYDEARKNPAWVAYRVDAPDHPNTPRPAKFEADSRTRARVKPAAYAHSGYDRGHMAPNYAVAVCAGEEAQRETFLMSNITPQLHALNDGLWRGLEQRIIRRYPRRFKEAWVTCGPVFDAGRPAQTIRDGIRVPDAFFLIVTDRDEATGVLRAQAYLVPHRAIRDDEDFSDYLTDIRTVERRTGLDFFPKLDATKQASLEGERALKAW